MSAPRSGDAPPCFPPPRLVLMDLDGTLIDTLPDISASLTRALAEVDCGPCAEDDVRTWVGNGAEALVRRALAAAGADVSESLIARALARFLEHYARDTCRLSRVYPGVTHGLDCMRSAGMTLACVTNKPVRHSETLLTGLGLRGHFALVLGGDSLPRRKPDPLPLVHAADTLGVARSDALLVGDSINDVRAARAAGMRVICVSYGYNHGDDIRAAGADAVIDSFAELPALLAGHADGVSRSPGRASG